MTVSRARPMAPLTFSFWRCMTLLGRTLSASASTSPPSSRRVSSISARICSGSLVIFGSCFLESFGYFLERVSRIRHPANGLQLLTTCAQQYDRDDAPKHRHDQARPPEADEVSERVPDGE